MIGRRCLAAAALAAPLSLKLGRAQAQGQSGGPLRLIVPLPPGGTSDLLSRVLGERIGHELGVSAVVDNRAGGSTIVGSLGVARGRPDGESLLLVQPINIITLLLQENPPINMTRDFAPIARVGSIPMAVAVHANSSIRSMADLAAAARARDGGITYGSAGPASMGNLATVSLLNKLGVQGTNIPFRGNSAAIQALLGEQIQMMFGTMSDVLELKRAGTLRLLCVTTDERLASVPDVPTTKELGMADLTPQIWYGFVVASATPAAAVARLQSAFAKATADSAVQERLAAVNISVSPLAGAEFMRFIEAEMVRWGNVIRANNIRLG